MRHPHGASRPASSPAPQNSAPTASALHLRAMAIVEGAR